MKKALVLGSLLALGAVASYGATTQCSSIGPMSATSLQTCEIGDKIFSNFSESGLVAGDTVIIGGSGFVYNLNLDTSVPLTSAFTLSFTVTVDPLVCSACVITQVVDQMFTQQVGGSIQVPNTSTASVTNTPGGVVNLAGTSTGAETGAVTVNSTSDQIVFSYTPGSNGQLTGLSVGISQASVPEPMTFSLLGAGLLGLGLLRKRVGRS